MWFRWKTSGKSYNEPFDEGKINEGKIYEGKINEGKIKKDSPIKKFTHKPKLPNIKGWGGGRGSFFLTPENRDKYHNLRDIREHMRLREKPTKKEDSFRGYKKQYKKFKEKNKLEDSGMRLHRFGLI